MNFNTIKQELNKKIKRMSEKDFRNFIIELERIYYKTKSEDNIRPHRSIVWTPEDSLYVEQGMLYD